jgi:hypothetical protein
MIGNVNGRGAYMQSMRPPITPQNRPQGLFKLTDSDSSRSISQDELGVLTQGITEITGNPVNAEEAMAAYDADGDSELNKRELAGLLRDNGVRPPRPNPNHKLDGSDKPHPNSKPFENNETGENKHAGRLLRDYLRNLNGADEQNPANTLDLNV